MLDICLCMCKECKYYDDCIRGGALSRAGIHTVSDLSEVCNEENDYEYFICVEDYYGTR